ncbi:MAG: 1-acyl-sn-glycerol-3-phosphate acyltransferase [Deltaproteobacteria bacterium]|nr:1-acyl-sn-glycerol-3-phosphate acyltransferase [Candidatus Tharpella sp.]
MNISSIIDLIISTSRSPILIRLVNRFAVNKNRIQRKRLIQAVTKHLLADYGREGMFGDLSVFEAKNLQLMHDNLLLRKLKSRAEGSVGGRHKRLINSINNIQQRTEKLKQLDGPDVIRFLSSLYLEDIAPDFDPVFLILFRSLAKRLFNNFVGSIRAVETETGTINELANLIGKEPVFFIANHVSNADHLPILFALNRAAIISPVVIGGSNLYHGISKKILPKINVCQIKRDDMIEKKIKWLGNPVYIETFKQHNQYMWIHNEPYLFYPEGGRSRNGKIMTPKVGIIKNIFEFVKTEHRQVHFIPLSISYTSVPEDLAIEESRKGINISYSDLIQELANLNREYGHIKDTAIHVNLGLPITVTPDNLPDLEEFSYELMNRVRDGIHPTSTYEVAQMILFYSDSLDTSEADRFSVNDLKNANPDYSTERLSSAIEIFTAKKFIAPAKEPDVHNLFNIINPDMLRQYANRTECEF